MHLHQIVEASEGPPSVKLNGKRKQRLNQSDKCKEIRIYKTRDGDYYSVGIHHNGVCVLVNETACNTTSTLSPLDTVLYFNYREDNVEYSKNIEFEIYTAFLQRLYSGTDEDYLWARSYFSNFRHGLVNGQLPLLLNVVLRFADITMEYRMFYQKDQRRLKIQGVGKTHLDTALTFHNFSRFVTFFNTQKFHLPPTRK